MSIALNQTKSVLSKALKRLSEELKQDINSIQILISVVGNEVPQPRYHLVSNQVVVRELTFAKDIYGGMDFLGFGDKATGYLSDGWLRFGRDLNEKPENLTCYVLNNANNPSEPLLYMYNKGQGVRYLSFEKDIFNN